MNAQAFQRLDEPIPVTVVTGSAGAELPAELLAGAAVIRPAPLPGHDHQGVPCPACAARQDIRALLFDFRQTAISGAISHYSHIICDLRGYSEAQKVIDALVPGKVPATGLRDHMVAKNFILASVVRV